MLEKIGEDAHCTLHNGRDDQPAIRGRSSRSRRRSCLPVRGAFAQLEKELKRLKHPAIVPILKLIGDSRTGRVIAVVSE